MAGVVHFSWIARYMEEAEHALWRTAGLSIVPPDHSLGFPRVAVAITFKAPLFFEDEFDVHVSVTAMSARSITYAHTIRRGETVIATGTLTAVCTRKIDGQMQATELPSSVLERISVHAS